MPEKQITEKQHYVPQVYLQGFSQDGSTIYEYNLKKGAPIKVPVAIESVCRERLLYEVQDENGEIYNANFLEDTLCGFEGEFGSFKRQLLRKVREDNFETNCFLSHEEKLFWTFYSTVQIMRNPVTLQGTKSILREALPPEITDSDTYSLALAYCLPFFKEPSEKDLNPFVLFLMALRSKVLSVGFARKDNLLTSDRAVFGTREKNMHYDFTALWIPITSNCGLLYRDRRTVERTQRNKLIPLSDERVRELNKGMAFKADQMILSKYPFRDDDIALIEEARMEQDKIEQRSAKK